MTDPFLLTALVEKWHKRSADAQANNEFLVSPGCDVQRCAEELEVALAAPAPAEARSDLRELFAECKRRAGERSREVKESHAYSWCADELEAALLAAFTAPSG